VYNSEGELTGKSIHVEFLEKVNGEWKFSFAAWLFKPEPEDEDEEVGAEEEEPETEETE
jgi:hypothetical protein